jgi:prepilin-type N-terminal cleavage/methylation domain-containing protein
VSVTVAARRTVIAGGVRFHMQMPWQAPAEERDGLTWPELLVVVLVFLVALAIAIPAILSR